MLRSTVFSLSIGLAVACAGSAHANLINNGSFDTGDFTDWSVTGDGIQIDTTFPNAPTDAYDASFSAVAGDPTAGVLSQSVTTTVGEGYVLDFSLLDELGYPGNTLDIFTVSFGTFTITFYGQDAPSYADGIDLYTDESLTIPGNDVTGTSTTLSFEGQNATADWNLDDVELDPGTPPSGTPIPESSALALFCTMLIAGFAMRRRRGNERRS